ncbi:MAG TPA: hypothetical protein VFI25_09735 [Planctomycetota bacterium]|jgi:hypothetical protein|nr:hypothetical protein [Planctomycetota bacterium]
MRSTVSSGRLADMSWSAASTSSLPSFAGSSTEPGTEGDFGGADGEDFLARAGLKKGRPVVVYVEAKTEVRDSGGHTYAQSHFADERVAISAKLFGLVKVREGTPIADSPELAGDSAPRIVVFDGKGKKIGSVAGPPSASRLYGFMKVAAASTFARSLEEFVREYRRLLDGIDAVEAKKQAVERHRDQLAASPTPALRRRVEALESEIKATSQALVAKEKDLLHISEKSTS